MPAKKKKKNFHVNVAGQKVVVSYDDLGTERLGVFSSEPFLSITLHKEMGIKQAKRVLMHEMFHCLLHVTGCGNNLAIAEEEAIVLALEYNVKDIIKQSSK